MIKQMIKEPYKVVRSENYNYNFNMESGEFSRWGHDYFDDPSYAPFPEILDIEITTKCNGPDGKLCGFCYKSNNPEGHNMTFEEFKIIIDKMPWLTQIALGADAHGITNPDMFKMMGYARSKGIIPNLTVADVNQCVAGHLAGVAGAVAVSAYQHAGFDIAYRSIRNLSEAGMKQINVHYMISKATLSGAYDFIEGLREAGCASSVNAIVFLSLKQKGKGTKQQYVTQAEYKALVEYCLGNDVPFGFDSCSAPTFVESVKDHDNFDEFCEMAEPCESTLFSSYINEKGVFYPCSFTEGWFTGGWSEGINVLDPDVDFLKDVWFNPRTVKFREDLISNVDGNGCRNCPAYAVCGKDMILHKENNHEEKIRIC